MATFNFVTFTQAPARSRPANASETIAHIACANDYFAVAATWINGTRWGNFELAYRDEEIS